MEYDLHNNVLQKAALDTTAISTNTTTAGAIIDTKGFESIEFVVQAGTLTDGAYTVKLEDGDDSGLSDAADVSSELVLGGLPAFADTEDNAVKRVGSISKKRYQRLSIVSTGVTTGGTLSAVALLSHARSAPTASA